MATAQRRAGDRVIVATSLTGEPGFENYAEYLTTVQDSGAELVQVDSLFKRERALNDAALTAIVRAIGDGQPTVVHAHAAIPSSIGLNLRAPVVQTMHGWSRNKAAGHIAEDLSIMNRVDMVVFPSHPAPNSLSGLAAVSGGPKSSPTGSPLGFPPATRRRWRISARSGPEANASS